MSGAARAVQPPHSEEAEQAVLGALLLDNGAWERVGDVLKPGDFYLPANAAIFKAVGTMIGAGRVADVITVFEAGHDLPYLNALAAGVPSSGGVRRHAEIIRERAMRRAVVKLAAALHEGALMGTEHDAPLAQLVDTVCTDLLAIQAGDADKREPRLIGDMVAGWLDALNDRAEGKTDAMSTGLDGFDRVLAGGLRPGEVMVIGARPSMGKSALALGVARHMAAKHVVLALSMEDSDQMLVSRQVAAAGRINLADLRRPDKAPATMWSGVSEAMDKLMPLRLWIDDTPALHLQDVRTKAQQVKRKAGGLGVVMVDYIQLMEGDGETRAQELTNVARGMKRLAKELKCGVVVMCQLNRKADESNAPPRLDHLAESGGIEQAADIIGLLWREARRNPKPENKHSAQVEFVKNKNGPTDTVRLFFDGATQRFEDMGVDDHGA